MSQAQKLDLPKRESVKTTPFVKWSFSQVNFNSWDVFFLLNFILTSVALFLGASTWEGVVFGIVLLAGSMKEKESHCKK
jgi:hypothetical protein